MNVERPRRHRMLIFAVMAAAIVACASIALLYLAIPSIPTGTQISPVDVVITDSPFQPALLNLVTSHNNTLFFVDEATNPPLVKLASESPWPTGFQPFLRGLTYGQNYTVILNSPGTYHIIDAESAVQGSLTVIVTG